MFKEANRVGVRREDDGVGGILGGYFDQSSVHRAFGLAFGTQLRDGITFLAFGA